jgi:hypothetical protein
LFYWNLERSDGVVFPVFILTIKTNVFLPKVFSSKSIRSFDDPCQPCLIVNWYQVPTLGRDLERNISVKFGSIPLIHLENKIEKFYDPSNCNNGNVSRITFFRIS